MRQYLVTRKIGPKLWELTRSYMCVPAGFITDGASVPKVFQNILSPMTGPHAEAAVVHDYNYSKDSGGVLSRKDSDRMFLEMMINNGTKKHRAYMAYYGVRSFGMFSYQKMFSKEKRINSY